MSRALSVVNDVGAYWMRKTPLTYFSGLVFKSTIPPEVLPSMVYISVSDFLLRTKPMWSGTPLLFQSKVITSIGIAR